MRLVYDRGTLLLCGSSQGSSLRALPEARWDARVRAFRAPAYRYAEIRLRMTELGIDCNDEVHPTTADRSEPGPLIDFPAAPSLRPYQQAALGAWELGGGRGVVVLPTGSGKTRVGIAAIAGSRSALCLVPTRVLLGQWIASLEAAGFSEVGVLGDGQRRIAPVTVSTFESAWRNAPRLGQRFELLVVDEAHHFGSGVRDEILEMSVATRRLGLSATPPEGDSALRLATLVGPVVYELAVEDLQGSYLADLKALTITVELSAEERRRYDLHTARFRELRAFFARLAPEASWADLVRFASQSDPGRRAMISFHVARRILSFPQAKRNVLRSLLDRHSRSRMLIFTTDNITAYAIARENLIMPITCDIGRAERAVALERFSRGELRALVSSRVLNEGIDVPDANIAVIVGGTGGRREHVQRVGRVLRPSAGKTALVYELVVRNSSEERKARDRRRGLASR